MNCGGVDTACDMAMFWLSCSFAAENPAPIICTAAARFVMIPCLAASSDAAPPTLPVAADAIWAAVAASICAWASAPRVFSMFFVLKIDWAFIADADARASRDTDCDCMSAERAA